MPLTKDRIIVATTLRVMDSLNAVNNVGHFRWLEEIHHAERDGYGNTKRLLSRASSLVFLLLFGFVSYFDIRISSFFRRVDVS